MSKFKLMAFTRNDLYYNDYVWTTKYTDDDPRVTGEPDSTLLARKEGWEMLYFVNKLAKLWGWNADTLKHNYQKIERAVRDYVPSEIRSQAGIYQWILNNHKTFWDKI